MPKELPKQYNPGEYEDAIYQGWEKSGFFNPDNLDLPADAKSYTIVLPPPNITDKLHLGHSAMLAIEDLLIRYHRMAGYRALWVPGTDDAAIATQNVGEKKLLKEEKLTRHDLGREKFLEKVWEFLKTTQTTILHQTRKMGASLDWSRQAFTLDEPRAKAVKKLFVDMYNEGVIYRGERIVNWCPRCKSTLADDEIDYKERRAMLYTFKYADAFPISIATTRPETKLGDTAVAVNPKDKRFKDFIGKTYEINFAGAPIKLKIIADRNVDMEFGTGALGVTPAHSMVDWKMAEENDLPIVKVIDEDGKILPGFGKYSGEKVLAAREMIVAELKQAGLMEKEEEIDNSLSLCYRCDTPIEPLPSKQWFVNVDKKLKRLGGQSLKEKAIEAAESGQIKFVPERFTKRYLDWMNNLHDWCISRQIWFGHRVPVYYRKQGMTKSQIPISNETQNANAEEIFVGVEAPEGEGWVQDEDTLDTWFSSGTWTFSTLGWPDNYVNGEKTGDLARFHPTQVLETGYEIITLWVSRMVIMSFFALNEIPFENVYLHGMILDKHGKKMSKSKGNGIDPLDVIAAYGTDAVRLAILMGNTPGNDARISQEKIAGYRNFVNKLWNISRFIIGNNQLPISNNQFNAEKLTLADNWILGKMDVLINEVTKELENYEFSQAGERLRTFTWDDLADWYLEISKFEEGKDEILIFVLENLLKLWHPFMPFVTEKIWSELGKEKLLMVEGWPNTIPLTPFIKGEKGSEFEMVKEIITAIRNARSENKVEPARKIKAVIYAGRQTEMIKAQAHLIKNLRTGISELEVLETGKKLEGAIYAAVGEIEIYLLGAVDAEKEKLRLKKEIDNLEKIIKGTAGKLKNKEFVDKAPEVVVKKEREKLDGWQAELEKLKEQIKQLK